MSSNNLPPAPPVWNSSLCKNSAFSVQYKNLDLELRWEQLKIKRAIKRLENDKNSTNTVAQLKRQAEYLKHRMKKELEKEVQRIEESCKNEQKTRAMTEQERVYIYRTYLNYFYEPPKVCGKNEKKNNCKNL